MKNIRQYESDFWKVLEKGTLADLSQYHRSRFCDEVPLYSRFADLPFLDELGVRKGNAILIQFALKFLHAVISYEEHQTPFFAAVTVWDFSDEDPVVPHLFACSSPMAKLREKLILRSPMIDFAKGIKRVVGNLQLPEAFEVREDTVTSADMPRVFIGPKERPYPSFVTLASFRKTLATAK